MTSTIQIVDKILELVDEHGFTTDHMGNVVSLKMALDDLINQHYSEILSQPISDQDWWEIAHKGVNDEPF
jgi:hypothetical protein